MEFIGVLLGIMICALGGCVWFMRRERRYLRGLDSICTLDRQRIEAIEQDKAKDVATLIRRFSEVDARFDSVESVMVNTEKTIKGAVASLASFEEIKIANAVNMEAKFSEVDGRLDLVESALATTEKTVKAITAPKARPISWSQARDAAEAGDDN
jgi:CBS-domain-containing membrane protein